MVRISTPMEAQRVQSGEEIRGNNVSASGGLALVNSASRLLRAPVCTGSGEIVGDVDDMLINCTTGRLEYLWVRPRIKMGSMCVRLSWKDVKLDRLSDKLLIAPGGSAVKRLLIRIGLSNRDDAMH